MSADTATVHIDGASRGNPGAAAYALVLQRPGLPVVEQAEAIGKATNNVAEYSALVAALERALELGVRTLTVFSDSELMVKQMNGEYRVKNADLQELYKEAVELRKQFASVTLKHVRREQNKRADELCNLVLDGKISPGSAGGAEPSPAAPASVIGVGTVREDAIECLRAAATAWANKGLSAVSPAQVWDQLWSILEDGGALRKKK
jgi:ribonuclease HI